jgi:hypothetical protein
MAAETTVIRFGQTILPCFGDAWFIGCCSLSRPAGSLCCA